MYLDKFGQENFDWMIDSVYQIYTNEIDFYGLKEPIGVDDFADYATKINS